MSEGLQRGLGIALTIAVVGFLAFLALLPGWSPNGAHGQTATVEQKLGKAWMVPAEEAQDPDGYPLTADNN